MLPTVCAGAKRVGLGGGETRSVDTRQGHCRQFNGTRIRGIFFRYSFRQRLLFALRRNKRLIGEISVTNIKFLRFSHTNSKQLSFCLSKRRRNPYQPKKKPKNSIIAFISRGFSRKVRSIGKNCFVLKKKMVDS